MEDSGSDPVEEPSVEAAPASPAAATPEASTAAGATAFAPGHVTALFAPRPAADPARSGSVGAGITLTDGVTATARPADEPTVALGDAGDSVAAAARVLEAMDVAAAVELTTPLPIGAGFGVSGAAALATAHAANELRRRRSPGEARSENALTRVAHVAEVEAGTGLGDVVAQARGGVPVRTTPGAPGHGALDGVPAAGRRVEYLSLGELSTAETLAGDTTEIVAAGERTLEQLRAEPTLDRLFAAARAFARDAELLTEDVAAVLDAVDEVWRPDGRPSLITAPAAMAMLGRSVVATGDALSAAGYEPSVCRIHRAGAGLVSADEAGPGTPAPPGSDARPVDDTPPGDDARGDDPDPDPHH